VDLEVHKVMLVILATRAMQVLAAAVAVVAVAVLR
jgi:hypothetical protein